MVGEYGGGLSPGLSTNTSQTDFHMFFRLRPLPTNRLSIMFSGTTLPVLFEYHSSGIVRVFPVRHCMNTSFKGLNDRTNDKIKEEI